MQPPPSIGLNGPPPPPHPLARPLPRRQLLATSYAFRGGKEVALELLHAAALAYYRSMPDSKPQRRVGKALSASQIVAMVEMRKPDDCGVYDARPQCCECTIYCDVCGPSYCQVRRRRDASTTRAPPPPAA